ncbi:hypothetical protein [Dermatobacter hominis]|uniref:hypothetical protein n=1 Tax=Dermatobacter hominis TaxID=2884263 RepID=UPI001D11698E|nr:hypothetical protein [Dermatobacter hominis]UDY36141.1 hypothetical protein LH044_01065 [Dermatobacter hominis]
MRGARVGAVGLVALLALAVVVTGCTDDGVDGGSATTAPSTSPPPSTTSTTPPRPEVHAQLRDPAVPVVDLPTPPFEGAAAVLGNDGDDVVAFGGQVPKYGLNYLPTGDVAVLDAATLSWSVLPPAPFEDPLIWPEGVVADGHLLVSGPACVGDEPVATTAPACRPGHVQTARLDLADRTWQFVGDPRSPRGTELVRLWATPTGVLSMAADNGYRPAAGEAEWSFLPTGAHEWRAVDDPPIPMAVACGSGGTVAVASVEQSSDGVSWAAAGEGVETASDRFRNVRAVFWDDEAGSWGAPTAAAVSEPLDLMGGACTAEGLAWAAMADRFALPTGARVDDADQGLYLARPGSTTWDRRPFEPPPGVGPSRDVQRPLPTMADPDAVVLPAVGTATRRVLAIDSGAWSDWVAPDVAPESLSGASLGGRAVARDPRRGGLVAVAH